MTLWTYEIEVRGHVPEEVLSEVLSELEVASATVESAHTVISATLPDQAALLGVLDRLQALGLQLSELRRVPQPRTAAVAEDARMPGQRGGTDRP